MPPRPAPLRRPLASAILLTTSTLTAHLRAGQPLDVTFDTTLSAATLDGPVTIERYVTLTLSNNSSLAPGGSITLALPADYPYYTRLTLNQPTLLGTGDVIFNDSGAHNEYFNDVDGLSTGLTFAPGITVRTGTGGGTIGSPQVPLTNQGTFSAQTSGRLIGIYAASLANSGTIQATNNARINILSTLTSLTNSGTLSASNGGTIDLSASSWSNTGSITADNGTIELGGTFTPASIGSISATNGGHLDVVGTLNLNGGTLTLSAARPFAISRGRISGSGIITSSDGTPFAAHASGSVSNVTLNAPVSVGAGTAPTFTSAIFNNPITVSAGGSLTLTAPTNNSSLSVTTGSTLTLNALPAKLGTVSLNASTLALATATFPTSLVNSISLTNSTLLLSGTLDNSSTTLALSPATAKLSLAGRITGGTITGPAATPVLFSNSGSTSTTGPTLDGVALAADATIGSARSLTLLNGLTLNNASLSLTGGPPSQVANFTALLNFSGTQSLAGTGIITFDGTGNSNFLRVSGTTPTLTIGPNITIRTGSQSGSIGLTTFRNALVLNGNTSAQTASKTLSVIASDLTHSGSMSATNASTLTIDATSFTNTGTITISPNSTLLLSNTAASAPNGTINLAGTTLLNYTGASPTAALRQQLALGRSNSTGIIPPNLTTNPSSAIAYIEASTLLNLTGSQTTTYAGQTVDATTLILLPTTQGDANLDGTLNAADYALLDRGYAAGGSTWSQGDFNYDGQVTSADYLLLDTACAKAQGLSPGLLAERESQFGAAYVSDLLTSIPEPATPLACVFANLFLSRRRRVIPTT